MTISPTIQSFLEPWLVFLAEDPRLRLLQGLMLLIGIIAVFLVFFTTRDILLRTNSFFYMFFCIVLVAILPFAGFFLYLLIRPARTLKEKEMYNMLEELSIAHKNRMSQKRVEGSKKRSAAKAK